MAMSATNDPIRQSPMRFAATSAPSGAHELFGQVSRMVRAGDDMTMRQFGVMMACACESEPQTVRGLAAKLNISKPAIVRAVDKLQMLGLAKRSPDEDDRRSVLITLTRDGHALVKKAVS